MDESRLRALLAPYLVKDGSPVELADGVFKGLLRYLDLLLRWNAKTNLTAVRDPEEVVQRHFGESLFAGLHLREAVPEHASVLDLGSGAGFPGLPIQLLCPGFQVTLAESQGKKAAFLREVVRTLGLATEVWSARVESMPPSRRFDAVTLRAVDRMGAMIRVGRDRLHPSGVLLEMAGAAANQPGAIAMPNRSGSGLWLSRMAG